MSKLFRSASVLAMFAIGFFASAATAAPITLTSAPPDVFSDYVQVSYTFDSGTNIGTLNASGFAEKLTTPPSTVSNFTLSGVFTLNATFSVSSGGSIVAPTTSFLSVTGNLGNPNYFGSGQLQQFGFTSNAPDGTGISNQTFQFVFGKGTGIYGSSNQIGVIIKTAIYGGDAFNANFNNTPNNANYPNYNNLYYSANADTFSVVPLPNAAYMGFAGLALVPIFMRRRRMA